MQNPPWRPNVRLTLRGGTKPEERPPKDHSVMCSQMPESSR